MLAVDAVIAELKKLSKPVTTPEEIAQVTPAPFKQALTFSVLACAMWTETAQNVPFYFVIFYFFFKY